MSIITCPCCRGKGEIEEGCPIDLSPQQFRIYDTVRKSTGISGPDLVDMIYSDAIDGGALHALSVLHVTIHRMNKKLAKAGLCIASSNRNNGGVYKLMRLES